MRGKKVNNYNQILQSNHFKADKPTNNIKKRVGEVKSLQVKLKAHPKTQQHQQIIRLPRQNLINDYQIERDRPQYIPYQTKSYPIPNHPNNQQLSRLQRNTQGVVDNRSRENYLINESLNRSQQHSQHKIQIMARDSKQKSVSRSQNSSTKKRGIELTKTLLKRISGMYNDKDFTNRAAFTSKQQREDKDRGGMTMSGRGVYDEYQISEFDSHPHTSHTINMTNSNQTSFNQSGHYNCTNSWNRQSTELTSSHPLQSNKYSQNILTDQFNQKPKLNSPKKQLVKIRSYNLINTQQTAESMVVGGQPPQRPHLTRRGQGGNESRQRYLIRSKNKTMDQISLKESLVVGNDHQYQ